MYYLELYPEYRVIVEFIKIFYLFNIYYVFIK